LKEYINWNLIDSGKFLNPKTDFKGEAEIETFKSTDTKSLTEIRVGYLKDNLLIYLQIFNPKIPGYNKYVEGEYFYQHDFSKDDKSYGNPALEFNEQNRNGILSILEKGLKGKYVGIENLGNGIWKVFYRNVFLGFFTKNSSRDKQVSIRLSQNML